MGMNFGEALQALKKGERVARAGWNGRGMWLKLQVPDAHSKMTFPYIYLSTVTGDLVPWLASQTDMLADDWGVLQTVDDIWMDAACSNAYEVGKPAESPPMMEFVIEHSGKKRKIVGPFNICMKHEALRHLIECLQAGLARDFSYGWVEVSQVQSSIPNTPAISWCD